MIALRSEARGLSRPAGRCRGLARIGAWWVTWALLPLVVDAVAPAPVLGADGIADGRELAAALMIGADGAWIGTRLVATTESGAH